MCYVQAQALDSYSPLGISLHLVCPHSTYMSNRTSGMISDAINYANLIYPLEALIPCQPNACADSMNSLNHHHDHNRYSSLCAPVYPSTACPLASALSINFNHGHMISYLVLHSLDYMPPPMRDISLLAAIPRSSRGMGYSTTSSRCNSIIGSLLIPSLLSGFALLHHGPELEAYEQCCAAEEGC